MAQFIQKFRYKTEYDEAEHQYPNISLVEGEGLIWTAEAPEPDVLLNGSKIKWNVTDGVSRTSVDYPSISFADAQTLINALNDDRNYTVTATINYNDGGKNNFTDAEVVFATRESNTQVSLVIDSKTTLKVADISLFSNAKAAAYNAAKIAVSYGFGDQPQAVWEINYTIENAR